MSGFKVGELILTSKPYVHVLNDPLRGKYCDNCCKKKSDLKRCSKCSFVYFCNQKCQIEAWDMHKFECKFIKKAEMKPNALIRLIALIIFKLKKYGQEEPFEEIQGRKVSFSSLMSHAENIKQDPIGSGLMMACLVVLTNYIGPENIPPRAIFFEIYGKICVNAFTTLDEMLPIGTGLYLGTSIFDHSCDPEAVAVNDGKDMNVRMIKNVPHRDIQKVFISYIGGPLLKKERQKKLKEKYYFDCQCQYCLSPENDELMTKLLNEDPESKELALKCQQELEEIEQMVGDKKSSELIFKACMSLIKVQNEVLADTNVYKVKALELAFDTCIQLQKWADALIIGSCLEKPLRLYNGNYHPVLGLFLFKMGTILLCQAELSRALPKLIEAESILIATNGEQHPLTKTVQESLLEARLATSVRIQSARKYEKN